MKCAAHDEAKFIDINRLCIKIISAARNRAIVLLVLAYFVLRLVLSFFDLP